MALSSRAQIVWFDMGNVLLYFSRARQAAALQQLPGCRRSVDQIIPFIDGNSDSHLCYERGELDRATFLKRLADFLETSASADQVEEAYATLFTRNDPVCRLATAIARTMPVGLATNSDVSHLQRARRDYPDVLNLFAPERTVASCECGHRKPSREFFACLLGRFPCPPNEVCFIDDLPANIAGAKEAGIGAAVEYQGSMSELIASLTEAGINVGSPGSD